MGPRRARATARRPGPAHPHDGGVTVQVPNRSPPASPSGGAVPPGRVEEVELTHEHEGIWVGVLPPPDVPDRLAVSYGPTEHVLDDPYPLPPDGEVDLHLINEAATSGSGTSPRPGSPPPGALEPVTKRRSRSGRPNARAIRLKGRLQQLGRPRAPDASARHVRAWGAVRARCPAAATAFSYVILGPDGHWREKADPMASWAEARRHRLEVFETPTRGATRSGWTRDPAPAGRGADERSTRCTSARGRSTSTGATGPGPSSPTSCRVYVAGLSFT